MQTEAQQQVLILSDRLAAEAAEQEAAGLPEPKTTVSHVLLEHNPLRLSLVHLADILMSLHAFVHRSTFPAASWSAVPRRHSRAAVARSTTLVPGANYGWPHTCMRRILQNLTEGSSLQVARPPGLILSDRNLGVSPTAEVVCAEV